MRRTLTAAVAVLAFAGCENPVSQEVHSRATGISLSAGSQEVVRVNAGLVTGGISLTPGSQTPTLTVRFLDEEGHVTEPRSGYFLEVESAAPGVATWVPDSPGSFTGRIVAHGAGSALLQFSYMHGRVGSPNAHADARADVTVVVTAAT